jgi:hypothetical protein
MFEYPCCKCDHPDAADARFEIIQALKAIKRGGPLPRPFDVEDALPFSCCRRKPHLVPAKYKSAAIPEWALQRIEQRRQRSERFAREAYAQSAKVFWEYCHRAAETDGTVRAALDDLRRRKLPIGLDRKPSSKTLGQ